MLLNLDQVCGAIEVFYAPATPAPLRLSTGKSLEAFQNTVYAWNASIELLSAPKGNFSLALFAAQTLKHKIVLDWRQLDEQAALGLRERLWSFIFVSDTTTTTTTTTTTVPSSSPVQIQLKLALAALIVQTSSKLWPDPVADLFMFANQNSQKISNVLDVLAMIPEQLSNKSIQFSSNDLYYQKCALLLEGHIDDLIQMVLKVLQNTNDDRLRVSKDLLACLLAWIQFGGNGSKIIESPEFMNGLFVLLHSNCTKVIAVQEEEDDDDDEEDHLQVIEIACELLVELIIRMSGRIEDWDDNQTGPEASANSNRFGDDWFFQLANQWIPCLSTNLCQLPLIQSLQLHKESLLRPLLTLLCESLELFLSQLMERKEEFKILSETVLAVSEFSFSASSTNSSSLISSSILELTFNFWAALPAELATFKNESDVETRQEPFLYLFSRLFASLLRGPLIFRSGGSAEDYDKFREFRHVVGDCLKDCVRVLGSTEALIIINSFLSSQIPLVQREGALFALRTISSSVDPRESEAMPGIAPLLLSMLQELLENEIAQPLQHQSLKMISAVVLNVGCYSEWLRYHSEFLGIFLQILSLSLDYALRQQDRLELPATVIGSSLQSLKYMCESCAGLLGGQYAALEGLFIRVYPWSALSRRDRLDLTEALSLVISRKSSWTDTEFLEALDRILQLIWQGGPGCLEDYAVVLECIMLPELPRTPLIFAQVFQPSFARLGEAFVLFTPSNGQVVEEEFCEAWLRVLQAVLNNGTPGAVGDFVNGSLIFWLQEQIDRFRNLSLSKQAALFNLFSSLISGQFICSTPDALILGLLSASSASGQSSESWISERCNLLRVSIIYVFTRIEGIPNFLIESHTFELLNDLLSPGRTLSSSEIVGLCGFLSALFGALQDDSGLLAASNEQIEGIIKFLSGLVMRICEAAVLEWPLSHINDLAMILGKTARDGSLLKSLTWSLFDPSTPQNLLQSGRLFTADSSTPTELAALSQDYPQALMAACKNYRPKTLRSFLKGVAETCRRRRGAA